MECTNRNNMDVQCEAMENIHELLSEICALYYEFSGFSLGNRLLDRMDQLEQRVAKICGVCNA